MITHLGHNFIKKNPWTDENWEVQYMNCTKCGIKIIRDGYNLCYNKAIGYVDMTSLLDITCEEYIIKKLLE